MGKRPFIFPIQKIRKVPDLTEWGNLKNKFSGKTLFRVRALFSGNWRFIALDIIGNKWFFGELLLMPLPTGILICYRPLKKSQDRRNMMKVFARVLQRLLKKLRIGQQKRKKTLSLN